ncbi:MAG: hypothetical protein LQ348_000598 [Seirophora lacunosa]|nr:MAG: hypothetical protein LQ348_000598 [Seirophora lacunosa]
MQVEYVKVAQTLPAKLLKFFARYPPVLGSATGYQDGATPIATSINTSSADPNANHTEATFPPPLVPSDSPNPFKPHRHPETGRWHDPVYSLRRQADLVKLARANGVEELLPYTFKGTEEGRKRREEHGLRVKGTGVGQRVKGKAWERTMKSRLEKRKQAMLGMPTLVQQWKQARLLPTVPAQPKLTTWIAWSWPWLEEVSEMTIVRSLKERGISLIYIPCIAITGVISI